LGEGYLVSTKCWSRGSR